MDRPATIFAAVRQLKEASKRPKKDSTGMVFISEDKNYRK